MLIQAELSLYPLKQPDMAPSIFAFVRELEAAGVEIEIGRMSSVITGERPAVFSAIERAYAAVETHGRHVLVVKLMNSGAE